MLVLLGDAFRRRRHSLIGRLCLIRFSQAPSREAWPLALSYNNSVSQFSFPNGIFTSSFDDLSLETKVY